MGVDVAHFWLTLILLGLGWNFGFVGASALVLECHRPEERTRVQSLNDFIVFGTMALGSFASGGLLTTYGWNTVLWVSFFPLAVAVAALVTMASFRPGRRTDEMRNLLIGRTPAQIVIAWLLAQTPWIVPIPGASEAASARGERRLSRGGTDVRGSSRDLQRPG